MDIDLKNIRIGAVTLGDLAEAFIPHSVADYATLRYRFPHELDPDNVPENTADRVAGRAYVRSGKVVGTLVNVPVAAVAAIATAGLTLASAVAVGAALTLTAGAALAGGVAGGIGWLFRRDTTPQKSALVCLKVASGVLGASAVLGVAGAGHLTAKGFGIARHLVDGIAQVAGMAVGGVTGGSIGVSYLVRSRIRSRVAAFKARRSHTVTTGEAAGPEVAVVAEGPYVPAAETVAVAPAAVVAEPAAEAPAPAQPRSVRVVGRAVATQRVTGPTGRPETAIEL